MARHGLRDRHRRRSGKRLRSGEANGNLRTADVNEAPGIELDVLIGNVEAQLTPTGVAEVQTLGGLVTRVYLEGVIKKDDGALTGQAGAIIPLKILTTS